MRTEIDRNNVYFSHTSETYKMWKIIIDRQYNKYIKWNVIENEMKNVRFRIFFINRFTSQLVRTVTGQLYF